MTIHTTNRNNSNTNKNNRLWRLDHYVKEMNLVDLVDWKVLVDNDVIDYFRKLMSFLDLNGVSS
jgi:hypothetical protein